MSKKLLALLVLSIPLPAQQVDWNSQIRNLKFAFTAPPVSPALNQPFLFTTALSPGSCVGGGSSYSWCVWNGSSYVSVAPGAFGSQTANFFYAAPNGSSGVPGFRAIVAADIPALSYSPVLTFNSPLANTSSTISLGMWGSGSKPVAAGALGVSGNCVQWGSVGLTDSGNPCGSGGGGGANALGYYWVSQAANAPSNAVNIGSLTSGLLKIAVSGSVATPSTAIAGMDYSAPLTFSSPLVNTANTISLNLYGNGNKPVAASALGASGNCMAWGTAGATDSGAPCAASFPYLNSTNYNWSAQAPGGSLTASTPATVTLTPCPQGVTGTSTTQTFYISGGTGTAEAVMSTGGATCTSGGSSGTVKFTPANSHSGAWTIQSATAGIQEALNVAGVSGNRVYIPAGTYTMYGCLALPLTGAVWLEGAGYDLYGTIQSTALSFTNMNSSICSSAIYASNSSVTSNNTFDLRSFGMTGPNLSSNVATVNGIYFSNVVRATISHVSVIAFSNGISAANEDEEITIKDKSSITSNTCNGISIGGTFNILRMEDIYLGNNVTIAAGGCNANVNIVGPGSSPYAQILLMAGVDDENSGASPFAGQTITSGWGLFAENISGVTISNSYFEGNVNAYQMLFQQNIGSLVDYNNWVNGQIAYGGSIASIVSFGDVFYGSSAYRYTANLSSNWATTKLGPDTCLNSSPECSNHPGSLGLPGATGSGSAALGANSPATTNTAPYTWLKMIGPDGSTLYVPAFK
jgi:hypothetical protein